MHWDSKILLNYCPQERPPHLSAQISDAPRLQNTTKLSSSRERTPLIRPNFICPEGWKYYYSVYCKATLSMQMRWSYKRGILYQVLGYIQIKSLSTNTEIYVVLFHLIFLDRGCCMYLHTNLKQSATSKHTLLTSTNTSKKNLEGFYLIHRTVYTKL